MTKKSKHAQSKARQNKGGRSPDGTPSIAPNPKRNAGHALSGEVIEAIAQLPQVQSGTWSKSYLAEQVWRNFLGLPADYDSGDLEIVRMRHIIE